MDGRSMKTATFGGFYQRSQRLQRRHPQECQPPTRSSCNFSVIPRWAAARLTVETFAISNNVGGVKQVFEHTSAPTQRRAPFRSHSWFALFPPGLAVESSGSGTQSDPTISSITNCDHDYFFELPSHQQGSGIPNHYVGDLLATMAMSGLSRVRTELLQLAIIQSLAPHPVQMHRQFTGHRNLGNLSSSPQGKVEELAAPLWLAAHRDLRRLNQQIAQQRVALFADVPKSAPIPARFF
jgi:hypothetical protein